MTLDSSTYEHSASEHHDITKIELIKNGKYIGKMEFIASPIKESESEYITEMMYRLYKYIDNGQIRIEGPVSD